MLFIKKLVFTTASLTVLIFPSFVFAQGAAPAAAPAPAAVPAAPASSTPSSTPAQGSGPTTQNFKPEIVPLGNPLRTEKGDPTIEQIVGRIITAALGIIGSVILVVFIAGGVMWLTSAGNSEKVHKGTMAMTYAVIGLLVIFAAYAILEQVIDQLTK